jgi:hypothetical protein
LSRIVIVVVVVILPGRCPSSSTAPLVALFLPFTERGGGHGDARQRR